jgi:hypothetical protein
MKSTKVYDLYAAQTDNGRSGFKLLEYASKQSYGIKLDSVTLLKSDNGKPYIENNPFYFNISHAKSIAVCVVSDYAIGVDIEYERPISQSVRTRLLGGCDEKSAVLEWTKRESFGKMTGDGVFFDTGKYCKYPHVFLHHYDIKGFIITVCVSSAADGFVMPDSEFPKQITWYNE